MTEFIRWNLRESDLENLDAKKARDIIIKCFFEAQKETFARSKKSLDLPASDDDIYKSVVGAVRAAFQEVEESFDTPTGNGLRKVVETLARKANAWGTPKDIIDHHKMQITKVLTILKG